ncbi:MAG: diguanylate cyclase [Gammaproteobacteria bacterium]|nr:diguanylate cyclase [Gammaproteobacteria bacterium]NVK89214.1 diguanylate cyclase [Gammaproteobacteria bacterium]
MRIIVTSLWLLCSLSLFADSPATSVNAPVRVGVFEIPPLVIESPDGTMRGFVYDYFELMKPHLKQPIEWVSFANWNELLQAGEAREIDAVFLAQKNMQRLSLYDFTRPILQLRNYFFVRRDSVGPMNEDTVVGHSVAVIKSSANAEYLRDKFGSQITLIEYPSPQAVLQAVASAKVDTAVLNIAIASHYMKAEGINNLKLSEAIDYQYNLAIATRSDQPQLNVMFESVLDHIDNSRVEALRLKWGLVHERETDWSMAVVTSAISAVFFLLSGYVIMINRRLKAEINKREIFEQQLANLNVKAESERQKARKEARTDPLTGIDNRRKFEEFMRSQIELFMRRGNDFCLMIIDIDHFKLINDEFGHDVGDVVLREVSHSVKKIIRPYDEFGRIGGEEFGVILPDTDITEAKGTAERLMDSVVAYRNHDYPELAVTVSIGLSAMRQGDDFDTLFKRADEALYQSKEQGRNRVTVG